MLEVINIELNKIYNMDCLEGLKLLNDNSIDLIITSPPYDDLRNYNGYSFDFKAIVKELYRVTKQGGVAVWVVGDKTKDGSETGTSFKQALYFKEVGWLLNDTMIYKKDTTFGTSGNGSNRYGQEFEYMFVFSKGKPKTFNPIMIPCKHAGEIHDGSTRKNRQSDGEEFDAKRKLVNPKVNDFKRKGNIWEYGVGIRASKDKIAFKHPAIFPEKLAEDHIVSWSNEGDLVLDIFMGSGTTDKMCLLNNRNYIGFELSKEYCDIAKERLKNINSKNPMQSV